MCKVNKKKVVYVQEAYEKVSRIKNIIKLSMVKYVTYV